jgi:hypothetical protein
LVGAARTEFSLKRFHPQAPNCGLTTSTDQRRNG